MIPRRQLSIPSTLFFLLLSCYVPLITADDSFKCQIDVGTKHFDLTSLNKEEKVTWNRETPPTTWLNTLVFNLCEDLTQQNDVPQSDQCPSGTRACLTKLNQKAGDSDHDRITEVIPVAQTSSLDAEFAPLSSPSGLTILMHGNSYPENADDAKKQSLKVNLICGENSNDPKFLSYDDSQVVIEWTNPAACGSTPGGDKDNKDQSGSDDGDSKENVGSGIGWFFLVLLLAFLAYFGLGAYHNYATYGATGLDLIPHRDFWQEVPYMLRDVVAHLCSSARPRRASSRSGYIAV